MTGSTGAWMNDDDDFGCFSSSDDEITPENQNKINVEEEAAVEPETTVKTKTSDEKIEPKKEILKSKAAISLPMTGATEAWMDDDDNFGGFSSSDDEITPEDENIKDEITETKPEEKVKEEASVEPEK